MILDSATGIFHFPHPFNFFLSQLVFYDRLAFFARDEDAKERIKGFKALKQSDKTALASLTAVLRLALVDGVATELRQNIVDFLDKPKVQRHCR